MKTALEQRPERVSLQRACQVLGLNRSTVYATKRRAAKPQPRRTSRKNSVQPRALSAEQRAEVLETLTSDEHQDKAPAQVYYDLLDQQRYLCSISTMHRILREQNLHGERRKQRPAQQHAVPRLKASKPNEVWTWDVTKYAMQQRGVYLNLYVVLDLYSRFVVAWMLSRKENSALATQLMDEAMTRYGIVPGQLTLHQDRGSPMIAGNYLDTMIDMDVVCSHSRPRVSNDNAMSESQFRTLKYQPDYPGRFANFEQARIWSDDYFRWYNYSHYHSGLNGFTPAQVFTGNYRHAVSTRQAALDAQYARYPERFVRARPQAGLPPESVAINPIAPAQSETTAVTKSTSRP